MRAIKVCLVIISFTYSISAQTIGTWKIYSDMKNVSAAAFSSANIWAATSGGAFKFNTSDSSYSIMTKADGLNSQALTSVADDNENKIWFGSQEGYINVFDPSDNSIKRIIDIFNSDKNQKQINDLFIKGDTVFVSIDFGLLLINAKTLSIYDSFLKLGNFPAETKILSSYKSNLIYACTESGVAVQKEGAQNLSAPESWDTYQFGTNLPAQSVSRILEFNGQILLGTSNGIYSFVNRTWQAYALQGSTINDMIVIGNILYLTSNNQLIQFTNGQPSVIYQNNDVTFHSITGSVNQGIYISTDSGLIQFQIQNNKSKIRYPNGPQNNSFVNLSVDPIGNLWVATGKDNGGSGFFKFDGNQWTVFNKANYPQIPSNAYYNVYAGSDTTVYLSNWGTGVAVFKNNNFEFYSKNNSSISGFVRDTNFVPVSDIKTDSKGNMWVLVDEAATRNPLSVYTKQKQWYRYSFTNPYIGSDPTEKMVIDQFDTKWFVIKGGNSGLYYFNENKTFTNSSDDTKGYIDGLLSNLISSLAIDRKGYLWIGTNVGVNVITDPSKPKVTSNLGLALRNQTVTCIAVDPLDNKWFGTKQGVFVLSSDGIQVMNQYNSKNSPIPNDDIKSIAFDAKNGIVYIGTDNGLATLQTSSILPLQSFNQLLVYPNPFIPGDNNVTSLTIDGLIRNSSIKILNISGSLIREIKTPGGKIAFWDGKDLNGNTVPTGIYIIVAYDEEANNVMTSKVAVIRK